ncbi:uncharacterized protein LOC129572791 isoform X2 [Sitodiplosis mosellana]|uniref:uncharacterized protein LOC129572791 isoform X2 n=1 Tax=Sitodiplosis mosellana TaxID=263140 RepID=UPI002444813B|nr:uncharacterized protein LOC129572791 isoform X2 [Sitodiplosis mosellana]
MSIYQTSLSDPQISAIDDITTAFNFMYKLLDEIKGIATHKERLGKTQRVIGLSTSLLQLVTQYERDFNINPDSTTQDGTQIGSLIWYRGVLGVIEELRKILIVEAQNAAVDNETAALRFENLLKIKKKWQRKAQRRYPGAR